MSKSIENVQKNKMTGKNNSNELLSPDYIENNEKSSSSSSRGISLYKSMNNSLMKTNNKLEEINDENQLIIKNLKNSLSINADKLAEKEESLRNLSRYTGCDIGELNSNVALRCKNDQLMKEIITKNCEISELSANCDLQKAKFESQVEMMKISENNLKPSDELLACKNMIYTLLVKLKSSSIEHQKNMQKLQEKIDINDVTINMEKKKTTICVSELNECKAETNLIRIQKQNCETQLEHFMQLSKPLQDREIEGDSRVNLVTKILEKFNHMHEHCIEEVQKMCFEKLIAMQNRLSFANGRLVDLQRQVVCIQENQRCMNNEIIENDLIIKELNIKIGEFTDNEVELRELNEGILDLKLELENEKDRYANNTDQLLYRVQESANEIVSLKNSIEHIKKEHSKVCSALNKEIYKNNETFSKNLVNYRMEMTLLKTKMESQKKKACDKETESDAEVNKLRGICHGIKSIVEKNEGKLNIDPELIKLLDEAMDGCELDNKSTPA